MEVNTVESESRKGVKRKVTVNVTVNKRPINSKLSSMAKHYVDSIWKSTLGTDTSPDEDKQVFQYIVRHVFYSNYTLESKVSGQNMLTAEGINVKFKSYKYLNAFLVCMFADYCHDLKDAKTLAHVLKVKNYETAAPEDLYKAWLGAMQAYTGTKHHHNIMKYLRDNPDDQSINALNVALGAMKKVGGIETRVIKTEIDETILINEMKKNYYGASIMYAYPDSVRELYFVKKDSTDTNYTHVSFDQSSKGSLHMLRGGTKVCFDYATPLVADKGTSQNDHPFHSMESMKYILRACLYIFQMFKVKDGTRFVWNNVIVQMIIDYVREVCIEIARDSNVTLETKVNDYLNELGSIEVGISNADKIKVRRYLSDINRYIKTFNKKFRVNFNNFSSTFSVNVSAATKPPKYMQVFKCRYVYDAKMDIETTILDYKGSEVPALLWRKKPVISGAKVKQIFSAEDLKQAVEHGSVYSGLYKTIADLNIFLYAVAAGDSWACTGDRAAANIWALLTHFRMNNEVILEGPHKNFQYHPKFLFEYRDGTDLIMMPSYLRDRYKRLKKINKFRELPKQTWADMFVNYMTSAKKHNYDMLMNYIFNLNVNLGQEENAALKSGKKGLLKNISKIDPKTIIIENKVGEALKRISLNENISKNVTSGGSGNANVGESENANMNGNENVNCNNLENEANRKQCKKEKRKEEQGEHLYNILTRMYRKKNGNQTALVLNKEAIETMEKLQLANHNIANLMNKYKRRVMEEQPGQNYSQIVVPFGPMKMKYSPGNFNAWWRKKSQSMNIMRGLQPGLQQQTSTTSAASAANTIRQENINGYSEGEREAASAIVELQNVKRLKTNQAQAQVQMVNSRRLFQNNKAIQNLKKKNAAISLKLKKTPKLLPSKAKALKAQYSKNTKAMNKLNRSNTKLKEWFKKNKQQTRKDMQRIKANTSSMKKMILQHHALTMKLRKSPKSKVLQAQMKKLNMQMKNAQKQMMKDMQKYGVPNIKPAPLMNKPTPLVNKPSPRVIKPTLKATKPKPKVSVAKPKPNKVNAAKPAAAKPTAVKPAAAKPTAVKPAAAKPTAVKPKVTKPAPKATKPKVTAVKPAAAKPKVTKPVPKATKPKPKVTAVKPAAAKPKVVKSAKK